MQEAAAAAAAEDPVASTVPYGGPLSSDAEESMAGDVKATVGEAGDAERPAHSVAAEVKVVRARWALGDLAALRFSSDYLFVFKQHDLHMDHAEEAVTLDTQLNHNFSELADAKTAFGFRHVHQLDYATSGLLCVALSKKAAKAASSLFQKRLVSKLYLALVSGHTEWDTLPSLKPPSPQTSPPPPPRGGSYDAPRLEAAHAAAHAPAPVCITTADPFPLQTWPIPQGPRARR